MFKHLPGFFTHKESRTVGLIFAFNSIMFGNWVTRIPDVKADLDLSAADLGLALLGMPIGSVLMMPICGWLITRQGLGRSTAIASFLFLLTGALPSFAFSHFSLMAALFFYGINTAYMDIAMNAAAAVTEKKHKLTIMSTCHGMWSLGAMIGSGVGSLFVGFGIAPHLHLTSIAVFLILGLFALLPTIFKYHDEESTGGHGIALPKPVVLGLAFIAFCCMLNEGVVADWSALYMAEELKSSPFLTGLAFSSYAMMMAIGRFSGDMLIPRIGNRRIVVGGALITLVGITAALISQWALLAIAGFALVGLGLSCIVPVVFSASAKIPGMSSGEGIAATATISYTGFLLGPPVIGWIADETSLTLAISSIGVLSIVMAVLALRVRL
ncbi:MAG: MFS transporter [Bacteroidota bacterium]